MTLPENHRCPDSEGERVYYKACAIHRALRHLRFARAEAAVGHLGAAVDQLCSAWFDLGIAGRLDREKAWQRLLSACTKVRREIEDAVVARTVAAPRRRRRAA